MLSFFSLVLFSKSLAQEIHLGYYAEIIRNAGIVKSTGSVYENVESVNNFGFGFGTSITFLATNPTSFRFIVGVAHTKETLRFENPGEEELMRGSISLKVPGHALFNMGKSNFRLVTGVTPSFNVLGGNDANDDLTLKAFDFSGDLGFNYRIEGNRISILPELKYSYSFVDAVAGDDSQYMVSIDKYLRNKFTLTIIFTN